ncbi:MAG: hypothetical protein ACTS7E_04850 [Arsenophonus sp. NC-CH8-MAG3]
MAITRSRNLIAFPINLSECMISFLPVDISNALKLGAYVFVYLVITKVTLWFSVLNRSDLFFVVNEFLLINTSLRRFECCL